MEMQRENEERKVLQFQARKNESQNMKKKKIKA